MDSLDDSYLLTVSVGLTCPMNPFAGYTQQTNQNPRFAGVLFDFCGGVRRQVPQGQGSLDRGGLFETTSQKKRTPSNDLNHCSRSPIIDQSEHLLPPTAITEADPLYKSHSRSCVQHKTLPWLRHNACAQMHPPHRRGSPSTRSALHGGQGTRINPVADVGKNCACNAQSLLHDIAAHGGNAGRCRAPGVPQSNGAARGFALPVGSWQLAAPCIPCCNRTRSGHYRQTCSRLT